MTAPGSYTTETNDMRAVHGALRAAFGAADGLVAGAGNDPDRVDTVASFFVNALAFLHVHHEGEDELIYPVLKERCPDLAGLIGRIEHQHTLIAEPTAAAEAAIADWKAHPGAETGAAVTRHLTEVAEVMEPHFGDEEDQILPLASAWVSQEEWGALPGHALRTFPADKPWLALGLIREGLDEEHKELMLGGMPPPVQQLWVDQWEPAFVQYIAEVRTIAPVGPPPA